MDYSSVKKDIMNKQLKRFYIFTGEERFVLVKYVQKIVEVSGKTYKEVDKVSDCRDIGSSLFASASCYVCYDDKEFMSNEKAWDDIEDFIGEDNMLILVLTSVNKGSKFYKHFADSITVFDKLLDVILQTYVSRELQLSVDNAKYLIDICDHDMGRLMLEIDKIRRYADE